MTGRGSAGFCALKQPTCRYSVRALPLLLIVLHAQAAQAPSVLLFGASLTAARDFAVTVAADRGWRVLAIAPAGATFEQTLEETDSDLGPAPARAIRVYADFAEESDGIRVSLHAEEWGAPGTDEEWMTDVTGTYGENLSNALSSLRAKWDAGSVESTGDTAGRGSRLPSGAGDAARSPPDYRSVGTWAYYAEDYARDQGCELTDVGAVLESAGPEWELHRIDCRDGRKIRVRCSHGDCTRRP